MIYLVISYDIHDFETFKNYPPAVAKLFEKYGAKVLAMETNPKTLEGKPKNMHAIVTFPSEEVLNTMYNDPDYKAIINMRLDAASGIRLVILNPYQNNA